MVIENSRVLRIDDQTLTFEFEVPIDGLMLPDDNQVLGIVFDDRGSGSARLLGQDSSKPGPHRAGLTVRFSLRLEGDRSWHHESAEIRWQGRLCLADAMVNVDVVIRIHLRKSL
jgi:hypothetical protein